MTSLRSTDSPLSEIASVALMVGRLRRIAERLERYALRFERVGDSRCVFTRVYADMTRALAEALPDRPWDDAQWVVRLAERSEAPGKMRNADEYFTNIVFRTKK